MAAPSCRISCWVRSSRLRYLLAPIIFTQRSDLTCFISIRRGPIFFLWSQQWEQPGNHALFAQAFGIGSMVTFGGFMLLLLDAARANFRVNPYLHGSARWAGFSDIKAAGLLNNDGVYVGAWRDKGGKIHYLRHAGPEHVLSVTLRRGAGRGLASLCRLCSPGSKACS
jgi:type IV secretion system protein VirD4